MRVLQVADFFPPDPGGMEAHVALLATELSRSGHAVAVATGGKSQQDDTRWPFEVTRVRSLLRELPRVFASQEREFIPPLPDPRLVVSLQRVIAKFRPEIVHAHGWIGVAASAALGRGGVPLCVTLHDYGYLCPLRTLFNSAGTCTHTASVACRSCPGANQGVVKRLSLVAALRAVRWAPNTSFLAVSSRLAEIYQESGFLGDVFVIPNFIDTGNDVYSPPPADGPVLFVGPDEPYKGLRLAEAAFDLVRKRCPDSEFHHVGGGRKEHRPEVGLTRSGRLDEKGVRAAMIAARVVVIPPRWEDPCPTVALEAMRAGRPVVAAAVGGLLDIVDDNVTGVLVPGNDPESLADAIGGLLADRSRSSTLGRHALLRVRNFDVSVLAQSIEAVYRRMLTGTPTGRAS